MNILHITIEDKGGAGIAAYRLHKELKNHGYCSKLLVLKNNIIDKDVIQIRTFYNYNHILIKITNRILKLLGIRKVVTVDQKYCFNGFRRKTKLKALLRNLPFQPDVIFLYWVTYFLNTKDIYRLFKQTKVPIFWYLMDMGPFTGGCHYAWDCKGYQIECGKCPAIYSNKLNDISFKNLKEKKDLLLKINLNIIVASEALNNQVKKSMLFKDVPSYKVLLSVNDNIFKPLDMMIVREKLKLPLDKIILFFGSDALENERKGLKYLIKALEILSKNIHNRDQILLLIAGILPDGLTQQFIFKNKYLGMVKMEEQLVDCYNASNLFLCSSIEDSGPMMINESIMCGTPVVSFEMGVATDLVLPGITGYRAKLGDSNDFATGIQTILNLNKNDYQKMRIDCRKIAIDNLTPRKQIIELKNIIKLNTAI